MKIKLDENLGALGAVFLKTAGIDVVTVADQGLLSTPDPSLLEIHTSGIGASLSSHRCMTRNFKPPGPRDLLRGR